MNTVTHITIGSMIKILVAIIGVLIFWYLKEVVFLIFIAFLLSAAATYSADLLNKKYNLSRTIGISFVFVAFVGIILAIVTLLVPAVITEGYAFSNAAPRFLENIQRNLNETGLNLEIGVRNIQDLVQLFPFVGANAVTIFQGLFELFTFGFLTIMLGFYISMDPKALDKVLSLFVPRSYKNEVQVFLDKSRTRLGNWALSQITVALTTGIFLYTILAMTQVRYATLLALIWSLSEIVPFVGPVLASIPVLIFSFSISKLNMVSPFFIQYCSTTSPLRLVRL